MCTLIVVAAVVVLLFGALYQAGGGQLAATQGVDERIGVVQLGPGGVEKHLSLIHISEPTRLRCISDAVFCLKKKKRRQDKKTT